MYQKCAKWHIAFNLKMNVWHLYFLMWFFIVKGYCCITSQSTRCVSMGLLWCLTYYYGAQSDNSCFTMRILVCFVSNYVWLKQNSFNFFRYYCWVLFCSSSSHPPARQLQQKTGQPSKLTMPSWAILQHHLCLPRPHLERQCLCKEVVINMKMRMDKK